MQTLIGFYVAPSAQLTEVNTLELGMFVESIFTQQGIGSEHPSFVGMKPQVDSALAGRFGDCYSTTFMDVDTMETADEFSSRLIVFIQSECVQSIGYH